MVSVNGEMKEADIRAAWAEGKKAEDFPAFVVAVDYPTLFFVRELLEYAIRKSAEKGSFKKLYTLATLHHVIDELITKYTDNLFEMTDEGKKEETDGADTAP